MALRLPFGIEEEFFLTDLERRSVVRQPHRAFRDACKAALGAQVSRELLRSQVELVTPILHDLGSAAEVLERHRRQLGSVAASFGMGLVAAGTHPLAQWREQRATALPRYERLFDDFQIIAQRNLLCGLHVHVEVPAHLDRIRVMNGVIPGLPMLLALSASSPFWARRHTGLMSYRQAAYDEWPRTGIPEIFDNEAAYLRYVSLLQVTGSLGDASSIWWAIRPSSRYPTLELRIADACPRIGDALCIAGLFRVLVRHASTHLASPGPPEGMTRLIAEENRWRAKRFGSAASFLDADRGVLLTLAEWLEATRERCGAAVAELDAEAVFDEALEIAREGGSAQRQLATYEALRARGVPRDRCLVAVVDALLAETRSGTKPP